MSKRIGKTLYTAKFYESPPSSESTRPSPPQPSAAAYLKSLFQTHVALNQMPEVPPSEPSSPGSDHAQRVEELREKVLDAYNAAGGNPASGKWGLLSNLLRTSASKGKYRYINTRTDAVPPEPGPDGWLLAENEDEWFEWEEKRKREQQPSYRKRKEAEEKQRQEEQDDDQPVQRPSKKRKELEDKHSQEEQDEEQELQQPLSRKRKEIEDKQQQEERDKNQQLKEKVEIWKRDIPTSPIEIPESPPPPAKAKTRATKTSSDGIQSASKSAASSSRQQNSRTRAISDVQEPLLPPSFPADLHTSTPLLRQKPSPIELVPSSSPLLSPVNKRVDLPGPSKPSASSSKLSPVQDVVSSSSPLSSPPKVSRVYGRRQPSESPLKRARSSSPTPRTAAKKIRAIPSPPESSSAPAASPSFKPASKAPVTPPRNTLPTLVDLIAASNQKRKSEARVKAKERERAKATVKEKRSEPPSKSPKDIRSNSSFSEERRQQRELETVGNAVINWEANWEKMAANHTGAGDVSPSKSLSSIAGSNSVESPEESKMDLPNFSQGAPFEPLGTSTQPMGLLGGESLGTTERGERGFGQNDFVDLMRYDSQMDVESNLQGVEKLLNADVDGYTGPWMGAGSDGGDEQWGGNIDSSP
ncbi:hypothetical protein MSAN_00389700 [Mycena sanguinolenta]|uniref:Uncharacterized protein n=1 Tax=Mycena sanguinolenta TaxID=230812 RepID=A0A8H6ZEX8_9AGAR|nr:hypothetical protein MSAN_00389700 [Mycena sanguinolenta]